TPSLSLTRDVTSACPAPWRIARITGVPIGSGLSRSVLSISAIAHSRCAAARHIRGASRGGRAADRYAGLPASWYIDLGRVLLDGRAAPLAGRVLLAATADMSYDAVGGLTLGADPVATAMLHAAAAQGRILDAFVVRKAEKQHGLQRRIEGPDVAGRRVLAVEDTSTTGSSALTAVDALTEAGAEVVGVAVLVERGARAKVTERGLPYRAVFELADLGLN